MQLCALPSKRARSYLKKVFEPNLYVGPSFQLLEILEYACGLKLGPALTLGPNPFFEMASNRMYMARAVIVFSHHVSGGQNLRL